MNNKSNLSKYGEDIGIDFVHLSSNHFDHLKKFSCGNSEIDRYFQKLAISDENVATYLWLNTKLDEIIALASFSCSKIDFLEDNEYIESIPAIEIKYFAVAEKYHALQYNKKSTKTLSEVIMCDTIYYLFNKVRKFIGASKIILYSVKKAVNFYEKCGFKKYESDMDIRVSGYGTFLTPMYFNLLPDDSPV